MTELPYSIPVRQRRACNSQLRTRAQMNNYWQIYYSPAQWQKNWISNMSRITQTLTTNSTWGSLQCVPSKTPSKSEFIGSQVYPHTKWLASSWSPELLVGDRTIICDCCTMHIITFHDCKFTFFMSLLSATCQNYIKKWAIDRLDVLRSSPGY